MRTNIKGTGGDPIEIDYQLEKQPAEWKIFDVNVLGVWLVDQYKSSFAQQIASGGIDGLINTLVAKNKAPAAPSDGATGAMTALPASLTLKDAQAVLESLRQSLRRRQRRRLAHRRGAGDAARHVGAGRAARMLAHGGRRPSASCRSSTRPRA